MVSHRCAATEDESREVWEVGGIEGASAATWVVCRRSVLVQLTWHSSSRTGMGVVIRQVDLTRTSREQSPRTGGFPIVAHRAPTGYHFSDGLSVDESANYLN